MNNNAVQCPHCGEYFLDNSNIVCPFCKKDLYDFKDIFGDIFGNQNNPFQNFTNQGDKNV